ncbi:MAG: alpha/beta hydrolase [Bacteroidetes bacterium]|nr:alpha/beta hydrolase [Bacteroidota bacterium]MCB0844280.1 alpha/beta hydrolase [Bacteroidota bacterium]
MNPTIFQEKGFQYVEKGEGPILILLHGLFGALSNFEYIFNRFSEEYKVIIPLLPIYDKEHKDPSVEGLTEYVEAFIAMKGIDNCTLLGNSLGGHIALVFTLRNPDLVNAMILTGSSGLFESGMGSSFPKRGSYEYIRERVAYTFYSPDTASKELVDEVFDIVGDNFRTLKILRIARSAQRHNMRTEIVNIKVPTLLIWGLNDNITPPRVAYEFQKLIRNSELKFIDKCGHAAMMEQPKLFNSILSVFLKNQTQALA